MTLSLQVCTACETVQYPQRDVCGACLGGALLWQDVAPGGTVLSWTRGHLSALPAFKDKVPLDLARIKLDAGPTVLAFCDETPSAGARVTLEQREGGILHAR